MDTKRAILVFKVAVVAITVVLFAAGTASTATIRGNATENETHMADDKRITKNARVENTFSTAQSSPGDIVPVSRAHPAGTEVGGILVQVLDADGRMTAIHSESWIAGAPDKYTMADKLREEPRATRSGGRRIVSCYVSNWRAAYRFSVHVSWRYTGRYVRYPDAWSSFVVNWPYDSQYRGIVGTDERYLNSGTWWKAHRKAHFVHDPPDGLPARSSYPYVTIWVNGRGGYDCASGT